MLVMDISAPITCGMTGKTMQVEGWEHHGRLNDMNLLVFVLRGTAEFQFTGHTYKVSRGDVVIIPAGTYYYGNTDDFCEYFFYRFSGQLEEVTENPHINYICREYSFWLPEIKTNEIYLDYCVKISDGFDKLYKIMSAATKYKEKGTYTARLMIDVKVKETLLVVSSVIEADYFQDNIPLILQKMISYIEKNLTQRLTVAILCEQFEVSPSYVARLFKKYLHTTPTDFINSSKMEYAQDFLENTALNISQIADALGYCDVYYFSKLFKKKYGKSPSKYRS